MVETIQYPKKKQNKVVRYDSIADYECKTVHSIVNESPVLHVSFVVDGLPVNLPMIGQMGSFDHPSAGLDEPLDLYIHGYVSARMMNTAGTEGMKVCVCASIVDGYILTYTPYSHNYNYRSSVIHGTATLVTDPDEKLYAMTIITDKIVPGRYENSRTPPTKGELAATSILKITVDSASAKVRAGYGVESAEDIIDENKKIWTGVMPISHIFEPPVPSAYNEVPLPSYISDFIEARNKESEEYIKYSTTVAPK
ncbi:hypothetical protein CANCADRAFT_42241 [Tortispora caseinolytica NRRL Y-17796]|uniref:Flavin-nucleotide-binding protein n=1 Tax=Tortispora caseinolytica NRRL Y-17796 TaxID=767744 RepID=A0A1E4TIM4_9ASCO|nr:hypothetical protein CANCADRAFT_42241 [Tortispora caseinolytica NRRL Y-17796]